MSQIAVIYWSQTGNTEMMANAICEGIKSAGGEPVLIVAAGDAKIDNSKYKAQFSAKAKMLTPDEVLALVGHAVGGVCPFAVRDGVRVFLDASLRRFERVVAACGSSNSVIELTLAELETHAHPEAWVDVCKGWEPAGA